MVAIEIIQQAEIRLINYTPEPDKHIYLAARTAYSNKEWEKLQKETDKPEKVAKFLNMLYRKGHHSVFEHANFTFLIEGCSRVCTHQLVRHRLASYTQQSQRYAGAQKEIYLPKSFYKDRDVYNLVTQAVETMYGLYDSLVKLGIPEEDARYIIPQAVTSRIVVTMNARELLHFFELRTCMHAQAEIRYVAWQMLHKVKEVAPITFQYAGPPCITKGVCYEEDTTCPLYKQYIVQTT